MQETERVVQALSTRKEIQQIPSQKHGLNNGFPCEPLFFAHQPFYEGFKHKRKSIMTQNLEDGQRKRTEVETYVR